MAEPQPKVLKRAASMTPPSPTLICKRITSPQAGEPTRPVPTLGSLLSSVPTLRGLSVWSMTFLLYKVYLSICYGRWRREVEATAVHGTLQVIWLKSTPFCTIS
jgi:hypothetical protein